MTVPLALRHVDLFVLAGICTGRRQAIKISDLGLSALENKIMSHTIAAIRVIRPYTGLGTRIRILYSFEGKQRFRIEAERFFSAKFVEVLLPVVLPLQGSYIHIL